MSVNPYKKYSEFNSILKRLTLIGAAVSLLSGCSLLPAEEQSLQPPIIQKKEQSYETTTVKRGNIELYLASTATAASDENRTVAFTESGGQLKKMLVNEGDVVKVGTPIAELDTGDLPTRIQLQKLTVEQKTINYQDSVKNSTDKDDIRLHQIELDREQLILDSLVKEYNKALLFSPIEGVVTYLNSLKPGRPVEAMQTIATISNPNNIKFVYEASEIKKIANVKVNEPVELVIDKKKYTGKVTQTPSSAPKTDDAKLRQKYEKSLYIALVSPARTLAIGEYAEFKLFIEKRENVLVVPKNTLKNTFGRYTIGTFENDRLKDLDVQIGLSTSSEVEIVQGVTEGQKIIINN